MMPIRFKAESPILLLLLFLPLMTGGSIYLYNKYTQATQSIHTITYDNLVNTKISLIQNFITHMQGDLGQHSIKTLSSSYELRSRYEAQLRMLVTPEVKYLYMLFYDESAEQVRLRYMLDTTINEEDRAYFKQKFDPSTDTWWKVKEAEVQQVHQQINNDVLWSSLVVPIFENGKVVAAIGVDFAHEARDNIDEVVTPLKTLYFYITIFMIIMLLAAYIQFLLYYRTRRRGLIDPLTKVYNRQYLFNFLRHINIEDYQILMLDIDHFKKVNDTYGHDIGDVILTSVTGRISSLIRKKDALIRYGGEEFILLLHKQTPSQCQEVANRIKESIYSRPVKANEHLVDLTLSIGVNPYPSHSKDVDEAIKIADEQLYLAKSNGRNRVEVYDIHNEKEMVSAKHINEVKVAIEESRIKCMYQPIFNAETGALKSYEVLVRMIDIDGKVISPHAFLPSIAHTQVYTDLTKRILELALHALRFNDIKLTINLDLQDLFNPEILEIILSALKKKTSLASNITFEILETQEVTNFEELKKHIDEIKNTGAKIALDDFGSGYANFTYLVHLGIDVLKIDGSLIRDIDKNKKARNIVQTINTFAQKMGIETVAEQIERREELEVIKHLGVCYAQGYYLGKPNFEFLNNTQCIEPFFKASVEGNQTQLVSQ